MRNIFLKFCPRCEQTLSIKKFVPNTARSDGFSGYCRKCTYEYNSEREVRLRSAAIAFLGGQCCRCGITDIRVLAIDHIHGNGRQERLSGLRQAKFYQYVLNHEDRYQLLCHNCNWIKRLEEDCFVTPLITETITAV